MFCFGTPLLCCRAMPVSVCRGVVVFRSVKKKIQKKLKKSRHFLKFTFQLNHNLPGPGPITFLLQTRTDPVDGSKVVDTKTSIGWIFILSRVHFTNLVPKIVAENGQKEDV